MTPFFVLRSCRSQRKLPHLNCSCYHGRVATHNQVDVLSCHPFQSPGLPDFSCSNLPKRGNDHKIYQMAVKYTKWP
jgi:hypothetical protein